jgi:hypothetical protein
MPEFNDDQRRAAEFALDQKLFLIGPAGTGKTTAGVRRLEYLISSGIPASEILVLTPQRSLQDPYLTVIQSPQRPAGGEITTATIGGLARRLCELFWPLAAEAAGFAHPDRPPLFLTLETAQYYMAYLVRPMLEEGYFQSITIDRYRLYSQILDNLNKSALVGFPFMEIESRLDSAFIGDQVQRRVYHDAQEGANRFRNYCLKHNLLDFSLQLDVFCNNMWPNPKIREYLLETYRHIIYDNLEEDSPRAHDILREWIPQIESAMLIYDEGGGFRRFLGADTESGRALSELCDTRLGIDRNFVMSPGISKLDMLMKHIIQHGSSIDTKLDPGSEEIQAVSTRFYPQLLDAIVSEVHSLLVDRKIPASEIVILAPYLSDALRFSLTERLNKLDIPWRSNRPSRSLWEEPACQALITLGALAHPHWNIKPTKFDVAYALMSAIDGLDLVRAQLLAEITYHQKDLQLSTFDEIKTEIQERITFVIGGRFTVIRDWLMKYREETPLPLDHFFRKLFGEVLSQAGFGYHTNLDAVKVAASLVESVRKFRLAMEPSIVDKDRPDFDLGNEYVDMLQEGVIAASYLDDWQTVIDEAVLIAPAHTFIMMNKRAKVQFWMDIGSTGWYERLAQPLTHPYVLSRGWQPGRTWTDADEVQAGERSMSRLVSGLLHRCEERIYICLSELGESGFEQRGDLFRDFQKVLSGNE